MQAGPSAQPAIRNSFFEAFPYKGLSDKLIADILTQKQVIIFQKNGC
jgi:hypothetical protein